MPDFPHLPLPQNVERRNYTGKPTPRKKPLRSKNNLENRVGHGAALRNSIQNLNATWTEELGKISDTPIRPFIDERVIPIFLQIDTNSLPVEALRGFGIEIISQEADGYIIGASMDGFNKLQAKISRFETEQNANTAYLWEIDNGIGWKRKYILTPQLDEKLDHLSDDVVLELDISIACNIHVSDKPLKNEEETDERYERRLNKWKEKAILRDEVYRARYEQFNNIVSIYGQIRQEIDFNDSFGARVELSVKGLKDILYNYPYVFEIAEHDYLEGVFEEASDSADVKVNISSPAANSPKVCIIDSGIMEGHRLLAPAIDTATSKSYVPGEGIADLVSGGGHGTRVAGVVLYPEGISGNGTLQLPFWIQNAKILNQDNQLPLSLFEPELMTEVVSDFLPTRIYNLSVNSWSPCKTNHMSLWAASIDKLIWQNDILFIISVGNIFKNGNAVRPGIKYFLSQGHNYPNYLLTQNFCRIANPSQSCFALSVGSVTIGQYEDADRISFAKSYGNFPGPSPFSRTGFGIWGMIKPDVVELAGDLVREKNTSPNIVEHIDTSPHLVKSIQTSFEATGRDKVGTSFAAPKVSNLVAALQQAFPNEPSLFYRALVVQSARLPEYAFHSPDHNYLRMFGYGIPSLERAIENNKNRITLYSNGSLNAKHADIYSLKIPTGINRPGGEFDILIEITLSYKANPRRTRMRTNSYLSHWLDWRTSKNGEPLEVFQERIINITENDDDEVEEEANEAEEVQAEQVKYEELPWKIRERGNLGTYSHIKRQDNTVQKDWLVMKSYNIPAQIAVAVMGHKGWSIDLEEKIPYVLMVSFEIFNSEIDIYNLIRIENNIEIETPNEIEIPA